MRLIALARAAVNVKQNAEKKGEGSKTDVMARASDSQLKAQLHGQLEPNIMRLTFLTLTVLKRDNLCCFTTINMFGMILQVVYSTMLQQHNRRCVICQLWLCEACNPCHVAVAQQLLYTITVCMKPPVPMAALGDRIQIWEAYVILPAAPDHQQTLCQQQ